MHFCTRKVPGAKCFFPNKYASKLFELLNTFPCFTKGRPYLAFMAESGVEKIASRLRCVYFRNRSEEGNFDIYSDYDSLMAHYRRIYLFWLIL
ncbi:MAG: DUF2812 domain-containing protein, partial [Coriobacteriaceae bacterium]|nr:DUF2812 domain-containing protein [Coriobacteriaceae bacterium]